MNTKHLKTGSRILTFLAAAAAICVLAAGVILAEHKWMKAPDVLEQEKLESLYHFAFISQNTDDSFWQSARKGAMEASENFNVAIEYNGPRFTNLTEEIQYLDIAIASRVDGIVTHVLDDKLFSPLIDKAEKLGIPVVTIENDAISSKRASYVGTSGFKLGSEAGKLIVRAQVTSSKIAVILNSYDDDGENVMQNLRVAGLRDAIKNYPDIRIKTVQTCKPGIFSAEEVTRNILDNFPEVNTILCTNSKDTLGVAQMIVDLNRVGNIVIIGYGDTPEILKYVENGVIYGTVASNPTQMGYESIRALFEMKERNRTSSYIDTGVHVITSENLMNYYRESEQENGEKDIR